MTARAASSPSRSAPLRLAFMGTPDFAVPALAALAAAGHEVAAVYCQPPRPAGRGQKERPSPVQAFAEARGWPLHTPKSLRTPEAQAAFAALELDVAVVVAYGLILPEAILEAPRLGCVNIHASLLPRWRGAAPIQRAILAGDRETGVTIMQMDAGLDSGSILLQQAVPITAETTARQLHDGLAALGAEMIAGALQDLDSGRLVPQAQPSDGVTYADKLDKAEGRLDWHRPAAELDRRVRAFTPWPGAYFEVGGDAAGGAAERIKVLAAQPLSELRAGSPIERRQPGTLLDERATVACGEGALRLLELQRPGKAPMEAEAFLRGFALPVGTVLP